MGRFEREWLRILNNRTPVAPYLHMNEVSSGGGPFHDKYGWDDAKRGDLIRDCLFFSQTLDKTCFRTFICSVDMTMYRKLKESCRLLPSVAEICNRFVPRQIFNWYLENFSQWKVPELYYFFDQNERFEGRFHALVKKHQKKSWAGLYNHWDTIKNVSSANMRSTLPLQLADMLAWAHHRKLTPHAKDLKWSHLHTMTDAVLPFSRKDFGAKELEVTAGYADVENIVSEYFNS